MRDVSWATVLDRLLYGHSDAAHLVAPLAIATTLGSGRPAQPLSVPFVLGLNGNAVTLANELAAKVVTPGELGDPKACGEALRAEALAALARGRRLRFGVVHRYSSHNYKLRYWLAASGIRPDEDVEIITVAPPFVADALASGEIDGACVGEPWNSVCVDRGVGTIVLATAQIWRRGVEKALAMREPVLEAKRPQVEALIRAMRKAGKQFVDPATWEDNAAILARPEYLGGDAKLIMRCDRPTGWSWPTALSPSTIPISCSSTAKQRTSRGSARRSGSIRRWCAGTTLNSRPTMRPRLPACSGPTSTAVH